jgi:hypothetical protein
MRYRGLAIAVRLLQKRNSRIIVLAVSAFSVVSELIFCIVDGVLHARFVLLAMLFCYLLLMAIYYASGSERCRITAYILVAVMVVSPFVVVFGSPQWFKCQELFSGFVAFVAVKGFGVDLFCITNGRPVIPTTDDRSYHHEYYMVDSGQGQAVLLNHYIQNVSADTVCRVAERGGLQFYNKAGDWVAVSNIYRSDHGYDILEVSATNSYQRKNLFGGVYGHKYYVVGN